MNHNAKVLVAMHKAGPAAQDSFYVPVFVGSAGRDAEGFPPNTARDDGGDNISLKNDCLCELTGLYWGWKNLQADYLGLVHYRRYFRGKGKKKLEKVLHEEKLDKLLDNYAVLLPKKRHYYIETIYSHYAHTFSGEHLDAAREIIAARCPEYLAAFDKTMKGRSAYLFNMFIMRRDLAERYCEWLFPILDELEIRIDQTGMSDFQRRFGGRVGERLLNVWLLHMLEISVLTKDDIAELPVIYTEKVHFFKKVAGFLGAKFFHKKYETSF